MYSHDPNVGNETTLYMECLGSISLHRAQRQVLTRTAGLPRKGRDVVCVLGGSVLIGFDRHRFQNHGVYKGCSILSMYGIGLATSWGGFRGQLIGSPMAVPWSLYSLQSTPK